MVLFARLLEGYPYMHHMILREAVTDVCPLVRAEVWAAVLGVKVRVCGCVVRAEVLGVKVRVSRRDMWCAEGGY